MDGTTAALQVAVLAVTLALTGCAALLSRPRSVAPDWPPSPTSGRRPRSWVALTVAAVLLFVAAGAMGLLAALALIG